MKTDNRNMYALKKFLKEYLDLKKDVVDEQATEESIRNEVDFKGAQLWILIFSILMASLGLNVNSTAVIIGAMLICPLLGPSMGIGLSVGIGDFELMKHSLKSFLLITLFGVFASTLFFLFTPIAEARSELLARTSPTIYDVFIALFGGFSGVIAMTMKQKNSVIPGVAIATALVPPLCTAGYGLSTGNLIYFLGAFYLYFINSVFICLATYIGVRVMHFKKKAFVDKAKERRVRRYIICIVILTMCPAIYLTIGIIKSTVYNANADKFVAEQLMNFTNTQLVSKKIDSDKREIRVVLVGANVSETSIIIARSRLNSYELRGTKLVVMQGLDNQKVDLSTVKDKVMHDFYKSSERQLNIQQRQIDSLNLSLTKYKKFAGISRTIIPELKVFYPSVSFLSISQAYETSADLMRTDTVTFAVLKSSKRPTEKEKHKISEWVKARLGVKNLRLIVE